MTMLNLQSLLLAGLLCLSPLAAAQDAPYPDHTGHDIATLSERISKKEAGSSTPIQWRLSVKEDPATKATLSWTTMAGEGEHLVYYGQASSKGNLNGYEHKLVCQISDRYKPDEPDEPAFYHHARLSELEPGTKYFITMVSNGVASDELHFFTAEADPEKLVLIHGGDSRSGIAARIRMNHLIGELVESNPEVYGFVHGGDYNGKGNYSEWSGWMSHNELITTKSNRLIPIIPTKGNHDGNPLLDDVFDFHPKDDPLRYCHDIGFGSHLALVTLDTNYAATGKQETYLDQALAKWRPKTRWLLTNYHRPLYPAVKQPLAHKEAFVPLFEKHNVDVALESDGHVIKRTVPIRNEKKDPTGVVYVGEGGLGVGQRKPKAGLWYLDPAEGAYASRGHHIMLLTLTKETLTIETILMNGQVPDKHTINVRP